MKAVGIEVGTGLLDLPTAGTIIDLPKAMHNVMMVMSTHAALKRGGSS